MPPATTLIPSSECQSAFLWKKVFKCNEHPQIPLCDWISKWQNKKNCPPQLPAHIPNTPPPEPADPCDGVQCADNYICQPNDQTYTCVPDPNHKVGLLESCAVFSCESPLICSTDHLCRIPSSKFCQEDNECDSQQCHFNECV